MLNEIIGRASAIYWQASYMILRHHKLRCLSQSHERLIAVMHDIHAGRMSKHDLVDVIDQAAQIQWWYGYKRKEKTK